MTHTAIPDYEITQRVTAIRLPNNSRSLSGFRVGGKLVTIVPVSLRVLDTAGDIRIEATGPRLMDDSGVSATWSTVTVHDAPEWVLAVLDGIR